MARAKPARRTKNTTARLDDLDTVRVGIYTRRSTDDEHQPYSIEAQDDRLKSFVESQPGWEVTHRFTDDASGATTDRDDLQRALTAARGGMIDVVLVYRVDRFSRNLRDMVTLLDELDQYGVAFRSATEPFDTSTPMGRMLVQMLGMFAQFERDTIIDRTITGLERKAAKGVWRGGRRPFGYTVNPETHLLEPHETEAAVVQLIFHLYTRDRLGSKTVARVLNDRGHRTTTGGTWSAYQVLRALSNRIYIGVLMFREITVDDCHPYLVDTEIFEEAQRLLAERGEDHAHRRANGSDYQLTGLMRCPTCHTAMIGTRATGKKKVYRYYTCHTRNRYDTSKCDGYRLNADAVEEAVLGALAGFYRDHHMLIADAVVEAQRQHHAGQGTQQAELASVRGKIDETNGKIDRYLSAFENGTIEEELVGQRLAELRATTRQLATRRDELATALDAEPAVPDTATLDEVTEHLTEIIRSGTDQSRKALVETFIAEIKITSPATVVPVFRIPQLHADEPAGDAGKAVTTGHAPARSPREGVRAMTKWRRRTGIEPA